MALTAYDPCPCGSGKKFKFCCHRAADEIERVGKLLENHQPRAALQIVERAEKQWPDLPWPRISGSLILLEEGEPEHARPKLEALLQSQPEHAYGIALFATVELAVNGFETARPAVYRALQRSAEAAPGVVAGLVLGIAAEMYTGEHFLAVRQHLALALRLLREQAQQEIFMRMLKFDSSQEIYYPLRSVHELAQCTAEGDTGRELRKAYALAGLGCWGPAARVFARVAEEDPQNAALWQNVGLCRAWDGDDRGAAKALHQAARLLDGDFEAAVELETLAQLVDLLSSKDPLHTLSLEYRVHSVSRLLTNLQEHERVVAFRPRSPDESGEPAPVGLFRIADRPKLERWTAGAAPEDIPQSIGQVIVYDSDPQDNQPATAFLNALESADLDAARAVFESAAADTIEAPAGEDAPTEIALLPRELQTFHWFLLHAPGTPVIERRRLEDATWRKRIDEVWSHQSLPALNGSTPREAAADPTLRLALAGALAVIEAHAETCQESLDLPALREHFGLERPRPFEVTGDTPLANLTAMQMSRLPVERLSDDQLVYIYNRALLIHHSRFVYQVLRELVSRPSCHDRVELNRAYMTLTELAQHRFDRNEAFRWIEQGRQHAQSRENAFELNLQWQMRELLLRLEDPSDPEVPPLAERIKQEYGPKLPNIVQYVESLLYLHGAGPLPTAMAEVAAAEGPGAAAAAQTTPPGRIWTPADTGQGEKKLWIPGRD